VLRSAFGQWMNSSVDSSPFLLDDGQCKGRRKKMLDDRRGGGAAVSMPEWYLGVAEGSSALARRQFLAPVWRRCRQWDGAG